MAHEIAPRLVRGLDYYTRTTFEFASEALESAQNALGGGGRYDQLAEEMGGPPSPGIGFGIGIERVLIACDAEGVLPTAEPHLDAYVVDAVGPEVGAEVAALLSELRETGLSADRAYGGRSLRAQTKSADRAGARYVVLLGRAEMEKGAVAVRDMESGEQVEVPRSRVVAWLHEHLGHDPPGSRPMSMRTHYAGASGPSDDGTEVALCGWVAHRRDHGGVVFIDLRDREGIVQVVLDPGPRRLRRGPPAPLRVRHPGRGHRPAPPRGHRQPDLPTGEVEVGATALEVLNEAEPPPFPLDERVDVDETLRLRHRYLDLRRPRMAANLDDPGQAGLGHAGVHGRRGFVDVETPTLTRSTPEGARDFLVPSRLQPGSFFALPQSPQLFKQLLMVGGLDRYYQVARCWRDEDLRADRQLEFTQLDVEASFVDQEDILGFIEEAVAAGVEAVTGERPKPFPRITWAEAMDRYGSDKPDIRFGMELCDLLGRLRRQRVQGLQGQGRRRPGRCPARATWAATSSTADRPGQVARRRRPRLDAGAATAGVLDAPVAKFLSDAEQDGLRTALAPAARRPAS